MITIYCRIAFILSFLVPFYFAAAQNKKDAATITREISVQGLHNHLAILAGEDMQGREAGTAAGKKAASYIESFFREQGFKPVFGKDSYQQYFPLHTDTFTSSLKVNGNKAIYGERLSQPFGK